MTRKGILNEQSISWLHSPVVSPTPPSLTFRPGEALPCHVAQVKSPVIATEPSIVISRERSESRNLFPELGGRCGSGEECFRDSFSSPLARIALAKSRSEPSARLPLQLPPSVISTERSESRNLDKMLIVNRFLGYARNDRCLRTVCSARNDNQPGAFTPLLCRSRGPRPS